MAAFKYNNYRSESAEGTMVWTAMNVKIALVNSSYVGDPTDVYLSEVNGIVKISGSFTSKTVLDGYARGLCPEILLFRDGAEITGVVLFDDTGDPNTSKLIAYIDDGTGLPFTPVGFDYTIAYDASLGGWFRL